MVLSQIDSANENNQVSKMMLSLEFYLKLRLWYSSIRYLTIGRGSRRQHHKRILCFRESIFPACWQELPCVIKYNQLYCTSPGSSYPATSIASFVEDNRALLRSARHWLPRVTWPDSELWLAAVCRRMFGEMQEKRVVTETTVTIVTTFGQTRYSTLLSWCPCCHWFTTMIVEM